METDTNNFYTDPILNSPYEYPHKHWEIDEKSKKPTGKILNFRRPADFVTPIPKPNVQGGKMAQGTLGIDVADRTAKELGEKEYHRALIDGVRSCVDKWRELPMQEWKVTAVTANLLSYWRGLAKEKTSINRPFFCQIEAVETAIWLTEVAPQDQKAQRYIEHLKNANRDSVLNRIALKMATGAGKTAVMAMIIAWQTLNAIRRGGRAKKFTDKFLIVTPGITIRDRLRVLLPNDPQSYYKERQLVPEEMLEDMQAAKVVITNYQAFRRGESSMLKEATKEDRRLLAGWRGEKLRMETDEEMIRRIAPSFGTLRKGSVMVINDEAHHCYREKQNDEDSESEKIFEEIPQEDEEEADENNKAARLWISGLEIVHEVLGISRVFDLSATPFFLNGSGYKEGTLFPWTMSDFSLMDAIECGIVKLPRVPIDSNTTSGALDYRNIWEKIHDKMPKVGARKTNPNNLDPQKVLPPLLQNAIDVLYGNYVKEFQAWKEAGEKVGITMEPCFAIVCTNTVHSKLIYDYISGYHRKSKSGEDLFFPGRCELFSNFDDKGNPISRPKTLLIDSRELESGEALTRNFLNAASDEIERFKKEILIRGGKFSAEIRRGKELPTSEILREVMNTVGKTGTLGESIRCVVSVSMLTEGWDANTVTHILGVRAFGTQLLCEQVVGRALRRYSYVVNDDGFFEVQYSNIFGIPFDFVSPVKASPPKTQQQLSIHVFAVPERSNLEITFPRVVGYRRDFLREEVSAIFDKDSRYVLTPEKVGATEVTVAGLIGKVEEMDLDNLKNVRENTILLYITHYLLRKEFCDEDGLPKFYLFWSVYAVVERWFIECFSCSGGARPAQLLYSVIADEVCEKIVAAITRAEEENARKSGVEPPVRVLLAPFNEVGSTSSMNFYVSESKICQTTAANKAHLNIHVCDSKWERNFCYMAERHPRVKAYVKNPVDINYSNNVAFRVPYALGGKARNYFPDFILLVDDGHDDLLHLVVEVKGFRGEDAKAKKTTMETYWIPGVNRLRDFGRWAFVELTDPQRFRDEIDEIACETLFNEIIKNSMAQKNV